MNDKNRRLISVIVLNEHGVLSRISGLFSGRGYNIDSLTVAPIPNSEFSRVSIVTSGDSRVFEQITKQLHKLIPIYKVIEDGEFVEKELVMIKIPLSVNLAGLNTILKSYNGSIANSNDEVLLIVACDDSSKITNFIKTMTKFSPIDIVRSGSVMLEM